MTTLSQLEKSMISYVQLDIELSELLPSKNNVVTTEVEDKHKDALLPMFVDFEMESEYLCDRFT